MRVISEKGTKYLNTNIAGIENAFIDVIDPGTIQAEFFLSFFSFLKEPATFIVSRYF